VIVIAADPEKVRDSARRILARPEFGDHRSIPERVIDWVVERLSGVFGRIGGGLGSGTGFVGVLIQAAVVVGAVVVVALVMRALGRAVVSKRRPTPGDGLVVVFGSRVDPAELMAEARRAEADGRWKQAALTRYRHLVAALILDRVIADVPGRTTGEYRLEYRAGRPATAGDFDTATIVFERAYYGDGSVSRADAIEMRRLASGLLPVGAGSAARIGRR